VYCPRRGLPSSGAYPKSLCVGRVPPAPGCVLGRPRTSSTPGSLRPCQSSSGSPATVEGPGTRATSGMRGTDSKARSFCHASVPDPLRPRPPLPGDRDVDVAIVGAGFTGLWTAVYLSALDPALRIAVIEREIAGFGASGRNGGWCSALFPSSPSKIAKLYGRDAAIALTRAMRDTVDEVGKVSGERGIDCHYEKGGTVVLGRTPVQMERARAEVSQARSFGQSEDDLVLLTAREAQDRAGATAVLGGPDTPHCAAIHPARR